MLFSICINMIGPNNDEDSDDDDDNDMMLNMSEQVEVLPINGYVVVYDSSRTFLDHQLERFYDD